MSRIGKKAIIIESDISVEVNNNKIMFSGPKGKFELTYPVSVTVEKKESQLLVSVNNDANNNLQGLYRSLIQNAVFGVKKGFIKTLELVGVGYRAETNGHQLTLHLGYSHVINIDAPKDINFQVDNNKISVVGIDKYLVGEIAATIRRTKPAEPYKGKGFRYVGEYIRKKAGKAAKTVGGVAAK
ncbi:50S ribosomal protein L6 [Candidatus Gottesmanbacteria bacterium RBG_13_37_7]|uniref:50S ribosomal protein L6 n=1 Tax=Candidatus Gottesmanbacteria bacterium RBG_13_37_7 TaxID=1798369 RepID=A0A1F5YJ77_9BACT|nr:MAG: 50S ribosomal protein L6 [Candidatus Gottesmanbacteria bacterium RBG_13_37_7]